MPKSKEVLSSTSGSDSDSDVDTKVCVIFIHLLFIYYQECQIQFISQPMKVPDVYINQVCYLNVFIVGNGEKLLWQQDLCHLQVLIKLSDIDQIFEVIIQNYRNFRTIICYFFPTL